MEFKEHPGRFLKEKNNNIVMEVRTYRDTSGWRVRELILMKALFSC